MSILLYVAGYQYGDAAELRYYYPILPMFVVMVLYFVDLLLDYSSPFLPVWTQVLLVALPAVTLALRTTAHTPTDVTIFAGPEPFCDLAQIVEAKPSFTEPMVGDDFVIHHVSYHAQVRSTGIVPATNAQAVNQTMEEVHAITYLTRNQDLADNLELEYGFVQRAQVELCQGSYTVLERRVN